MSLAIVAVLAGRPVPLASAASLATPAASPTASPSPTASERASSVTLSESPGATGAQDTPFQLVADLAPQQAWGAVTLLDNGHKIASAVDYTIRWSYATEGWPSACIRSPEIHPERGLWLRALSATIKYTVTDPSPSPSPTPSTPPPSHSPQPTATASVSTAVTATKTATSTPSAASPTPSTSPKASDSGSLPFTGFDAIGAVTAAAILIGSGLVLVLVGRRWSRRSS